MRLSLAVLIFGLLGACSSGRYPCPPKLDSKNTEKDGSGIELVKVEKNKDGLIKRKQPKKIRKKIK